MPDFEKTLIANVRLATRSAILVRYRTMLQTGPAELLKKVKHYESCPAALREARGGITNESIAGAGRPKSWRCGGRRRLTHPNLCAIAFKRDFVHQLIDEVNSAAVLGMEDLICRRAGNRDRDASLCRVTQPPYYL